MTKHVVVKRIPIPEQGPFDYVAAKAERDDAIARGDRFEIEGRAFVVRTAVFIRRSSAA